MPSYRRENTVLRASLEHPKTVHVIPNALIADQFKPSTMPISTDISEFQHFQEGSFSNNTLQSPLL